MVAVAEAALVIGEMDKAKLEIDALLDKQRCFRRSC